MDMTAGKFRQSHLLAAIREHGSIENLAKALEMSPQYLSQLKNGTRGIGHKTARKIEHGLGWPEGTMDHPLAMKALEGGLAFLLISSPESEALNAITEAVPRLSEEGVRTLAAALLERMTSDPVKAQK